MIDKQLQDCVDALQSKPLSEYFSEPIAQHVYYVAGFLCRAGEKEKERRTDQQLIGDCIGAINDHFDSSSAEIEKSNDLPQNLAGLVDKRSVHGGLKYPNRQFYSLVAKMEYCYSRLATPHNLTTFGGVVLSYICKEIAKNDSFLGHFKGLFKDEQFDEDTLTASFKYYVKVFANLRLKDLCRKYNSELHKTTTANFRSGLATKGNTAKKGKSNRKNNALDKDVEPSAEELHNEMIAIVEDGLEMTDRLDN